MEKIFSKPQTLNDVRTHYCPGCGHGIAHRLLTEVIDELGIRDKVIAIAPVGCAVLAYDYWDMDVCEAPHGRPCAVATGMKAVAPENIIFTYQGDGDLASIGFNETFHAANRGENITVLFINNGVYGMTGGQMAPTTLMGQKTKTSPRGRAKRPDGFPIRVCEMLSALEGVCYATRVAVNSPKNINKAKSAIKKGFRMQMEGKGFSIVEVLSMCPVYWNKTPLDSVKWIDDEMVKCFPLGEIKNIDKQEKMLVDEGGEICTKK